MNNNSSNYDNEKQTNDRTYSFEFSIEKNIET